MKQSCCSASRGEIGRALAASGATSTVSGAISADEADSGMILIPGGSFLMGNEDTEANPFDGEGPVRNVSVDAFYIDPYAVTNAEFQKFIRATGYRTEAESFGWSYVFHLFLSEQTATKTVQAPIKTPWWRVVEGANWAHPEGEDSGIEGRMDHPVVHVSWNDAVAYCNWAGKRLPTEAEWEYAARGGLVQKKYAWGDQFMTGTEHHCNIWQGNFPVENYASDGYSGTAPVHTYKPNGFGLYQMSGNVWEWCADWFSRTYHVHGKRDNPAGPTRGQERVMRGGSYLCHKSYCNRYRVAARSKNTSDSSTGNIGFRCVKSAVERR
ncbi:formylglycine-generating enzyme family protein [Paenibacillus chitinolyticus]